MTETGNTVTLSNAEIGESVDLVEHSDKLTFTVPASSPVEGERGTKQEKEYTFGQVAEGDDDTANAIMRIKGWTIQDFVNDALKGSARSNAYQTALAPHKPSEVSAEDIVERMVRDYIRLGIPEDVARKQVSSMLASK
jgi:hypothetical protein